MEVRMFSFNKTKKKPVELPQVLTEQENPVNYNTVLDYLVGLSKTEYDKMFKVSNIYRNANKDAAKVLGVKDEPTVTLKEEKATDEEIDGALDEALETENLGFLEDEEDIKTPSFQKKAQAAEKKIDVNVG
jgi:hypothetical protein